MREDKLRSYSTCSALTCSQQGAKVSKKKYLLQGIEEEETSCTHTADTYMIMITYESYDYLEMKKIFGC